MVLTCCGAGETKEPSNEEQNEVADAVTTPGGKLAAQRGVIQAGWCMERIILRGQAGEHINIRCDIDSTCAGRPMLPSDRLGRMCIAAQGALVRVALRNANVAGNIQTHQTN